MNKFFVLTVILIGLVYLGYKYTPEDKGNVIYGEARVSFRLPGRDIEAVAVSQRYESWGCTGAEIKNPFLDACIKDNICVLTRFECKQAVGKQYQQMLGKGEASTHYVYLTSKTEPLKGVVLLWGLTQRESKSVCDEVAAKFNSDKHFTYAAQCI